MAEISKRKVIQPEDLLELLQFLQEYGEPIRTKEVLSLHSKIPKNSHYIYTLIDLGFIKASGAKTHRTYQYGRELLPSIDDMKRVIKISRESKKPKKEKDSTIEPVKFTNPTKQKIYDWLRFLHLSKNKTVLSKEIKKKTKVDLAPYFIKTMINNNIVERIGNHLNTEYRFVSNVFPNIHMVNKIYEVSNKEQSEYQKQKTNERLLKIKSESKVRVDNNNYDLNDFKLDLEKLRDKLFNNTGLKVELTVKFVNEFKIS